MADLKLEHIYKVYPNGTKAVNDVNLDIKDKEFIVLVGPSGCGKSTTLRMIAGLEDITTGELYIDGVRVNDMEPKDRDIAMVFQNYALYPHMTVYENMAFGLTLRHLPKEEIHKRVIDAAKILGLSEYLDRKPRAMSGGQRQRVSLGRAILRNPKVMLLDEPLSNLDAKLRSQMRSEISKLHQRLQTTFVYVTHDQTEAMTLGTRVVVMKLGVIQQVDTPKNLYNHPKNKFVAGFIGTPQMNFFDVTLEKDGDDVRIHFVDDPKSILAVKREELLKVKNRYFDNKTVVTLGFRSEDVRLSDEKDEKNSLSFVVSHLEELGNETLIYGDLAPSEKEESLSSGKTGLIVRSSENKGFKAGDSLKAVVNTAKIHLFDGKTEETILPEIPLENLCDVSLEGADLALGQNRIALPKPLRDSLSSDVKDVLFPVSGVHLGKGPFKAVIHKKEEVEGKTLLYLRTGNVLLFAFGEKDMKEGEEVLFSLDFETMTFKDGAGKTLLEALPTGDAIFASFTNWKTAFEKTKLPWMEEEKKEAVTKATEASEASLLALKKEKEEALKNASTLSKDATKEKDLETLEKEVKEEISKAKSLLATEKKKLKYAHKGAEKEIRKGVYEEYAALKEKEKKNYLSIKAENRDKNVVRAAKDAYDIFNESFLATREHDLQKRLDAEGFEFEANLSALKSQYIKTKGIAEERLLKAKKEALIASDPTKYIEKEYAKKEKALKAANEEKIVDASLFFYFEMNGVYLSIPRSIVNKIIEGLGTKVFTSPFRLVVPHFAYRLDERGLPGTVLKPIEYGSEVLYPVSLDEETTVYVSSHSGLSLKEGEKIALLPDLSQCEIYEDRMNVRLY